MKRFFFVALLIILLMGGGAFAGWHFWTNKNASNNSSSQQTKNDPSEGGKYLVIKEWGVRFRPDDLIKGDLYYGISKSTDFATGTPIEVVHFASRKLDKIAGNNCRLLKEGSGQGLTGGSGNMLVRIKEEVANKSEDTNTTYLLKVGGYWYYSLGSKGSCIPDQQNAHIETDITQSIMQSLNTLETDKT